MNGQRFCVQVFEEASGETKFSKGFDRDRVPPYSMERQPAPDKTSTNSIIPCSLEGTSGGGQSASPAKFTGHDKPVDLCSSDSMNDKHGCRSPLGKRNSTDPAGFKIITTLSAEPPLARSVSYPAVKKGEALMETRIETIKRREKKVINSPFSVSKKPSHNLSLELIGPRGGESGPSVLKATWKVGDSELGQATTTEVLTPKEMGPVKCLELAKVKPRCCQVCKTKSKRQKKSLKTKSPGSGKKSGDSNMPRAGGCLASIGIGFAGQRW
ncbi:hypothetical protein Ancab_029014 [Ancistrocladus abbreviatus]